MRAIDRYRDACRAREYKVPETGDQWRQSCPGHGGDGDNLAVTVGRDGRVLLTCHSHGCTADAIAQAVGLTVADLFDDPPTTQPEWWRERASFDYVDADGQLVYQIVRQELGESLPGKKCEKRFRARRKGPSGEWIWKMGETRPVLYRLPDVNEAMNEGRTIYIAEGEKSVDRLCSLGVVATTNPFGAGRWLKKGEDAYGFSAALKGADVVLVPDNDDTGRQHMRTVGESLTPLALSVRVLELPNLPPKGDIVDWVDAGRVHFVTMAAADTESLTIPRDVSALAMLAREKEARWLHIDAIMGTLSETVDAYGDHEVRRALGPLKTLAEELNMLITFIRHPRKQGGLAVHAGGGSAAFGGLARVNLFAGYDPSDTTVDRNDRRRVFAVGKNNLEKYPPSRTYQVVTAGTGTAGCIAWGAATNVTADDLAQPQAPQASHREPVDRPRAAAEVFLEEVLANGTRLKSDVVKAMARVHGLSWRTVERAAGAIGVSKERSGFAGGSEWYLANGFIPATTPANLVYSENSGGNGGNGTVGGGNEGRAFQEALSLSIGRDALRASH